MERATGRREAHKLATRAALQAAATRLFAEQGFEATTTAEIARAAHVAERTLYRYFDGKEELLAARALAWVDAVGDAIRERPAAEPPWVAVTAALVEAVAPRDTGRGPWTATDLAQPLAALRRAAPRPLRRLEASIDAAVLARLRTTPGAGTPPPGAGGPPAGGAAAELQAEVVATVAVAALRTAVIRHRRLEAAGGGSPGIAPLLRDVVGAVEALCVTPRG